MAGTGNPFCIDSHPQRALIITRLLDGLSIRDVIAGLSPPISSSAAQRYKTNVIKPVVAREGERQRVVLKSNGEISSRSPLIGDEKLGMEVAQEIQHAPVLSLFRQRLENLNGIIDETLRKARSAVRVATDKHGNEVVVGADIGIMAPLINQAHKNVEMLGRATGELEPQGGGSVSIQILCPSAGASVDHLPRITFASTDQPAIEGIAEAVEPEEGMASIGVLQGR